MTINPFAASASIPGRGHIKLAVLPPSKPVLEVVSYQYPLKLIAPAALSVPGRDKDAEPALVHTVYLLTYGGGLVAGDNIDLHVDCAPSTRLILLTQGSTKIFKSPSRSIVSTQITTFSIADDAVLVYLPDPVQPFGQSVFEQKQIYDLQGTRANLCVCDWVCEGRSARGEKWQFQSYTSRNEVWSAPLHGARRLLLRDNLILDNEARANEHVLRRMDGLGIVATLTLGGPLFEALGSFFILEFGSLPRLGGRRWEEEQEGTETSPRERWRARRLAQEKRDGLLWTAAKTRGFVVIKFGARQVEGAKRWLKMMLEEDGSIEEIVGERALLCLR